MPKATTRFRVIMSRYQSLTVDSTSLSARRRLKMLVARDEDLAVDVEADGMHIPEGMLEEARARCMSNPRFLSVDKIYSEHF